MDDTSYGLIVEGFYDERVFPEFVRKIVSSDVALVVRPCGGVARLMRLFPRLLRDLEHVREGRPVDKTLVIRDWPGARITDCEQEMFNRVQGMQFAFRRGVQFCGVRKAMEAWLLVDQDAINSVARERNGRTVPPVQGQIEDIVDPKGELVQLLSEARVPYDPEVCREIAHATTIERHRYRCPSFRSFEKKVHDC